MRAGMAAPPQQRLQQQQHHHHQAQPFQQSAPGASPASQVSVAELAKIFGARQRSASLQRQPQCQQQQQPPPPHYPTMDKRPNPAHIVHRLPHQPPPQRDAAPAQSPARRAGQPTPVYADPRAGCGAAQQQLARSGSHASSSGRWRSQESLSEASPPQQLLMPSGNGGGLMFRSVQVEPPPRLLPSGVPPVSQSSGAGALPQSQSANLGNLILRPSAFRPVRIGNGAAFARGHQNQQQHQQAATPPSGDSGFIDANGGRRSQEPPAPRRPAQAVVAADCGYNVDEEHHDVDDDRSSACAATSPSDSGLLLSDYENLLREKDNELAELRRTMEQNESALVRVFEERQGELESRLRNEMALNARLTPAVSLGNRRLRQSEQAINDLRLQAQQQLDELESLKSRLRATEAELRDRSGRVQQLEASLAASRESLDAATWELRRLRRMQVNSLTAGGEDDTADGGSAPTADRSCQTAVEDAKVFGDAEVKERQQLLAELAELRTRLQDQKAEFDRERAQWLEEKSQVLNYQKQLQMNYLQLTKRSQRLEAEAQQLSVDLETKEMHILRLSNGGCSSGASSSAGTLQSHAGSQC